MAVYSLESIAVQQLLRALCEEDQISNELLNNISLLGRTHLILLVQHASHFLQIAQLEYYYCKVTQKELSLEIPNLQKYYFQLLPPSIRETIDPEKDNIKAFSFTFHLQYAIQNEYSPEIYKYTLSKYLHQLCTFGADCITNLQLRCNLSIFFTSLLINNPFLNVY